MEQSKEKLEKLIDNLIRLNIPLNLTNNGEYEFNYNNMKIVVVRPIDFLNNTNPDHLVVGINATRIGIIDLKYEEIIRYYRENYNYFEYLNKKVEKDLRIRKINNINED